MRPLLGDPQLLGLMGPGPRAPPFLYSYHFQKVLPDTCWPLDWVSALIGQKA